MMTQAATTQQLGVSCIAYLHDRFRQAAQIPPLADLLRARAATLSLGHPGHHGSLIDEEPVDRVVLVTPSACRGCGTGLEADVDEAFAAWRAVSGAV